VILAGAGLIALLGLGALARLWFAPDPDPSDDKVFSGIYTSDTDIRVTNLTISGGHVRVGYALDVLYRPSEPGTLRCGLVDTSGSLDFFEASRTMAQSGGWTHLEYAADYDLPELTLGIRCSPSQSGPASMAFRDIRLYAGDLD
jgi:hypothetical protein